MSKNSPLHRRAVLDGLQSSETIPTGPLAAGLRESDKLVVASFFSPYVCQRFRRALTAEGVSSTTIRDGGKTSVEVGFGDREVAWRILAKQQIEFPDRRPRGTRRAFDFTILGGVVGTFAGAVSFALSPQIYVIVAAWVGFIGTGIIAGYVADRFQRRQRYLGLLQFDITDCLLLTAATGLVVSYWTYLSRLF